MLINTPVKPKWFSSSTDITFDKRKMCILSKLEKIKDNNTFESNYLNMIM